MTTGRDLEDALTVLIDLMDSEADSRDDVEADLVGLGVDLAESRVRYAALLQSLQRDAVDSLLDAAARERERDAARRDTGLARVRLLELPTKDLERRIVELGGRLAARGHEGDSREDLESQLADLLDAAEED